MKSNFGNAVLTGVLVSLLSPLCGQTLTESATLRQIETDLTTERSQYFMNLDFSEVTSGRLLDYSLDSLDSEAWDGDATGAAVATTEQWWALLGTLRASVLPGSTETVLPDPDGLWQSVHTVYSSTSATLALLDVPYHRMDQSTIDQGGFITSTDGLRLSDDANRTTSPYIQEDLFAVASLQSEIFTSGEVSIVLPAANIFTAAGSSAPMEIDMGLGNGFKSLQAGVPVSAVYTHSGDYILTVRKGVKTAQARITVRVSPPFTPSEVVSIPVTPRVVPNCGIVEAGGTASYFNSCDGVFDKPFIVVEGFDPFGNQDANYMANKLRDQNLFNALWARGYDFVFLDFTHNQEYIQANAEVLQDLIQQVIARRVGNAPLQVMGLSMGGLIGRYALAEMESQGQSHEVANFFTFDTPHQGVNMQLGIQLLLKYTVKAKPSLAHDAMVKAALSSVGSHAARQMMLLNSDYLESDAGVDPLRVSFYTALQNLGHPQQCNIYAIANGSGAGTRIPELANWNRILDYNDGKLKARATSLPTAGSRREIANLEYKYIVRWKNYDDDYTSTPETRGLDYAPGGTEETQARFAEVLNWKLGGTANLFGRNRHSFVPTVSALDLQNQEYGVDQNWFPKKLFYNLANNAQQLPTPFDDVLWMPENPQGNTNIGHVTVTPEVAEFVVDKVEGITLAQALDCLTVCTGSITGVKQLCHDDVATYSIGILPPGTTVSWTTSSNLALLGGHAGTSVQVAPANLLVTGAAWVQVTYITPNCGTYTDQFSLHIGPQDIPEINIGVTGGAGFPDSDSVTVCAGSEVVFGVTGLPSYLADELDYDWLVDGGTISIENGQQIHVSFPQVITEETATVEVILGDGCGVVDRKLMTVTIDPSSNCQEGGGTVVVFRAEAITDELGYDLLYPNPADHQITIPLKELASSDRGQLTIYDIHGRVYLQEEVSGRSHQIRTQDWPEGLYLVSLRTPSLERQWKLQIQH